MWYMVRMKKRRGRPRQYSRAKFRRALEKTKNVSEAARTCGISRQLAHQIAKEMRARIVPTVVFD
jgi:hypothetical protein